MATAIEERIKQQEEKLKQLKAQKAKIEARQKAVDAKKKRSDDNRRKILAGALVLNMMEANGETKQRFLQQLDKFLTREDDRKLFGLYPKTEETITTGN